MRKIMSYKISHEKKLIQNLLLKKICTKTMINSRYPVLYFHGIIYNSKIFKFNFEKTSGINSQQISTVCGEDFYLYFCAKNFHRIRFANSSVIFPHGWISLYDCRCRLSETHIPWRDVSFSTTHSGTETEKLIF